MLTLRRSKKTLASPASLLPPPLVAIRPLGTGGEGDAWLAEDPLLKRRLVCKRLHVPPAMASHSNEEHPLSVLRTLVEQSVPGMPVIYGLEHWRNEIWLRLEYIEGVPLLLLLEQSQDFLGDALILSVIADLFEALAPVHKAGLVHGDITPANVVVTPDGRARFIDFGIATLEGTLWSGFGSPGFLAPELAPGAAIDSRADLYALGALLYTLLGVEPPVAFADAGGRMMLAHPSPPALPSPLEEVLWTGARALTALDPSGRPSVKRIEQSLRRDANRTPKGGRDNLGTLVTRLMGDAGKPAKLDKPPVPAFTATKDQSLSRHSLFKFATIGLIVIATVVIAGWKILFPGDVRPSYDAEIAALDIAPTTSLPANFDERWVLRRFHEVVAHHWRKGASPEHRVAVSVACDQGLCQLVLRHAVADEVHWHQRALLATATPGVWRGVMRDLAMAVVKH